MAMNAAQITQELESLEAKTKTCAEQLRELYRRYLEELSNTASQQLMTVCYHLCTESYPEAFLGLSPQKRQALQDKVRGQGEKLRQQLSLEGLLLPEPDDGEEASPPRIAVIKAELTGDDLEVLTSALDDDNSDRILALLQEKNIDLPFDLEAVMQQRQQLRTEAEAAGASELDEAEGPQEENLQSSPMDEEEWGERREAEPTEENAVDQKAMDQNDDGERAEPDMDAEATSDDSSPRPPLMEGYSSVTSAQAGQSAGMAEGSGRSLGRRFLEDILSGRPSERRLGNEDAASMSGEGSLQVEDQKINQKPNQPASQSDVAGDREAPRADQGSATSEDSLRLAVDGQDEAEPDRFAERNFADNNGFDPNFEPPPAEDRYEPTPLRASDKLDISPGVLASALAAEGQDDRGGMMLMRPTPHDGTTELSGAALRDPFALIRWVERMERGISQRLRQSSQRMTRTLEKSQILNNELPDGLLEAAVRPDGDHEDDSDSSMPHVLSLRLNAAGKDSRSRRDKSIRIVAIYLRLSEIEFATPGVMAWRNQLRNQVKQLQRLSKQYRECKHAQNVVEAQALWRHGWLKD